MAYGLKACSCHPLKSNVLHVSQRELHFKRSDSVKCHNVENLVPSLQPGMLNTGSLCGAPSSSEELRQQHQIKHI